jgi:predicted transcriptional regulator
MPRASKEITETEFAILEVLWNRGAAAVRQIVEELYEEHTQSLHASVRSLLDRLAAKGYVTSERLGSIHLFSAVISREKYVDQQLRQLADTHFDGSMVPMLLSMVEHVRLSRKDRDEIRRIIERIK